LPAAGRNIYFAADLERAAYVATALSRDGKPPAHDLPHHGLSEAEVRALADNLTPGRRFVRGLYSGGTFSYEAMLILEPELGAIWSSTPLSPESKLNDPWTSTAHTVVDLGDDTFTRGRPHPMIDHRLRNERIVREAQDPETAVILLDVVLGYGAHLDPAEEMVPAIEQARDASVDGPPVFVASVTGTAKDPQDLARQEQRLRDTGVILADSNAQAARLAAGIASMAAVRGA
jgi:FdrA protein